MDKEEKQVLKFILRKELSSLKNDEKNITFSSLPFLKSLNSYERILKKLLKDVD